MFDQNDYTEEVTEAKSKKKNKNPNKPKTTYTEDDKKTLKAIIDTPKFSRVILGESSSNSERQACWEQIKDLFNSATGKNVTRKQLRDYYSKQKEKEKQKHDKRILASRKLKLVCSKTGSGPMSPLPADDDPDETDSSMFSHILDPVKTGYNKLSKPTSSSSTLAGDEPLCPAWNEPLMVNTDGSPVLDSMGNPVKMSRNLQLPEKNTINVVVTSSPLEVKSGDEETAMGDNILEENKENNDPSPRTKQSGNQPNRKPTEKRNNTSSEKSLPSSGLKTSKRSKKIPSMNEGVNEFYKKAHTIQKRVGKHRITLLKKKIQVEDLKFELLKQKAAKLGLSVPDNLFESDSSSSDSDESSENEDYDPYEVNK